MHSSAQHLNETIYTENKHLYNMLSLLGRNIYFPNEGNIAQALEAKEKAYNFVATTGIATENEEPMHLKVVKDLLPSFDNQDIFPYAPTRGKEELRLLWKKKLIKNNPSLKEDSLVTPIVTAGITQGLSVISDLFVDPNDTVILPDKSWENYEFMFGKYKNANVTTYPLFNSEFKFNSMGLKNTILSHKDKGKVIIIFNFPNNPTGFTPSIQEKEEIKNVIKECADQGINIVAICDDAYYGLFYEDSINGSTFEVLHDVHPKVFAVKLDGATKEDYVWGLRIGFITFSLDSKNLQKALDQKVIGVLRATTSSGSHVSQTVILHALKSKDYMEQKHEKFKTMKTRANRVKQILSNSKFNKVWDYYPFNSGYFICLKIKSVDARKLRIHLLENYGVGVIALNQSDVRIAFSCIEENDLEDLFEYVYKAIRDLV